MQHLPVRSRITNDNKMRPHLLLEVHLWMALATLSKNKSMPRLQSWYFSINPYPHILPPIKWLKSKSNKQLKHSSSAFSWTFASVEKWCAKLIFRRGIRNKSGDGLWTISIYCNFSYELERQNWGSNRRAS